MTTARTLVTANELFDMPDDGFRYELVKGEVKRMPPAGSEHGVIIIRFVRPFSQFVEDNNLGLVFAAETGFRIASNPDTVRAPDAAFVSKEKIPVEGVPRGFWDGAPDMAIEVISPSDTYTDVEEKVHDWLDAGTQMVVVINPRTRTVTAYHSHTELVRLTESGVLSGGNVVPGFELQLSELFRVA